MSFNTGTPYFSDSLNVFQPTQVRTNPLDNMVAGRYRLRYSGRAGTAASVGSVGRLHWVVIRYISGNNGTIELEHLEGIPNHVDLSRRYFKMDGEFEFTVTEPSTTGISLQWDGVTGQSYAINLNLERIG